MPVSPQEVVIEHPNLLDETERKYITGLLDKYLTHRWSIAEQHNGRELSWHTLTPFYPDKGSCFSLGYRTFIIETYSALGWGVKYMNGAAGERYLFTLPEELRTPLYT